MRDGRARVCVATDVAARGIDLPGLGLVIHADLPSNSETLLHRSGRTGRAGRKGVSALIVPGRARRKQSGCCRAQRCRPSGPSRHRWPKWLARDEERLLSDPVWSEQPSDAEREFAGKLLAKYSPEQIAAGYLRLHNARLSAPEDLSAPELPAASRERTRDRGKAPREPQPFGESVWFSISIGRSRKAEPRWLLPMLCRAGNITAKVIGAIRVQEAISFVEIQAQSASTGSWPRSVRKCSLSPGYG
jgi:ATP-dependent RNA helicase DeaD